MEMGPQEFGYAQFDGSKRNVDQSEEEISKGG